MRALFGHHPDQLIEEGADVMAVMELEDILEILPHRYPMLLVDRVIECDFEKRIVGIKNLTFNEIFFQGHFPGHPVMPGVLQIEAMAQVGGILINKIAAAEKAVAYFMAIDNAKFRQMIRPGDQMRMELEVVKMKKTVCVMHGKAFVDGKLAVEADMTFFRS